MSQEFTTYRSVFDKSEYIKQGYIITYDDLDSVDDLPELSTLERQDIYHARTGDLSSDYIVPVDADESGSFDEWRSLVDGERIGAVPDAQGFIYNEGEFEEDWIEGLSNGEGSQSKEDDHLRTFAVGTDMATRTWVSDFLVDVTDWDTLVVDWDINHTSDNELGAVGISVLENQQDDRPDEVAGLRINDEQPRQENALDISDIEGEYYISTYAQDTTSDERESENLTYSLRVD